MRTIRPATAIGAAQIESALMRLRHARRLLRFADCPRAVRAVSIALKSVEGAQRHMRHRVARMEQNK